MKISIYATMEVDLAVIEEAAGKEAVEDLKKRALNGELKKEFIQAIKHDWEDEAATLKVEKLEIEM